MKHISVRIRLRSCTSTKSRSSLHLTCLYDPMSEPPLSPALKITVFVEEAMPNMLDCQMLCTVGHRLHCLSILRSLRLHKHPIIPCSRRGAHLDGTKEREDHEDKVHQGGHNAALLKHL